MISISSNVHEGQAKQHLLFATQPSLPAFCTLQIPSVWQRHSFHVSPGVSQEHRLREQMKEFRTTKWRRGYTQTNQSILSSPYNQEVHCCTKARCENHQTSSVRENSYTISMMTSQTTHYLSSHFLSKTLLSYSFRLRAMSKPRLSSKLYCVWVKGVLTSPDIKSRHRSRCVAHHFERLSS